MNHYQQSLVVEASSAGVYAALVTAQGLRGWWTRDCDAGTGVGATIDFRFGPRLMRMRIDKLEPDREVAWTCIAADSADTPQPDDEWLGTQLVFRLTPDGARRTRVDFEHVGLVPTLACYAQCERGWRHFLASLQQYVATGRGTPHDGGAHACAA